MQLQRKNAPTAYERWGGMDFFTTLVERFYEGLDGDPLLRPLYPDDLEDPKLHLALFLAQYWGGPPMYNEERGHPRLRMRHVPFTIGAAEAAAWFRHMAEAVDASGLSAEDREQLLDYLGGAARNLINAET